MGTSTQTLVFAQWLYLNGNIATNANNYVVYDDGYNSNNKNFMEDSGEFKFSWLKFK